MISAVNKILLSNSVTRRIHRRIIRTVKNILNVPDAYADLTSLIMRTSPDAILDIGSHVGVTIARILEIEKLPIHGFEPTAESFEKLSKRFANQPLVSVHNIALCDKTGEAEFHCNANEQTNSLLDNAEGNKAAFAEYTRHVAIQKIQTVRLDDWMEKNLPSARVVIKCDVQGAEGLVLAGGMKTFREQVIGFYSEAQIAPMYHGQLEFCGLHKLLVEELGFALHNIYPCMHDQQGRAVQTDALWIKEDVFGSV